jgi:hypothetical protein
MGAEAAGQRSHALDGLLTPLTHHIGGTELLCQRDPIGMTSYSHPSM